MTKHARPGNGDWPLNRQGIVDDTGDAALTIHAGYGLARYRPTDRLSIEAGLRYEDALQSAAPDPTFGGTNLANPTRIANDYFLPSATITWETDVPTQLGQYPVLARMIYRGDVRESDIISTRRVNRGASSAA